MTTLRRTIAVLAASVAAVILPACDGATDTPISGDLAQGGAAAPKFTKVRLQLNWVAEPEFGGFYAAEQKALYQIEGLEVELVQGGPECARPQLVASGKVEFATIAATQLVELNEQGGDLVALYAVYQSNPMGVMVHESSPFSTLMELWQSDATLAIQDGLADFQWLSTKFPGGRLKIVPYTSNLAQFAAQPALASQCFVPSEPTALELQGVKTRVFMMNESGFDPYNTVVVTTRGFYEQNRALCAKFVKASAAGWRAYLDAPRPFNETMARLNPAMPADTMDRVCAVQSKLIQNDETKRVGLGGMRYARWEEIVNQLHEIGKIKAKPDPQSLFAWDTEAGTAR